MDHPSSELMVSLLEDRLDDPTRSEVAEHIDECRTCQATIEGLTIDDLDEWKPLGHPASVRAHAGPAFERILRQVGQGPESLSPGGFELTDLDHILEPAEHHDDLGQIGHYRIRSVIGHGGMGVVFEAIDPELQRTVALKVLRSAPGDAGARQRFVREAQAAARVKHDNVVTIFAVSSPPNGSPYLAMEYLPGPTLRALILAQKRLSPRLAAELCAQGAEGVAAAHAAGLVHRDIKPNNILLAAEHPRLATADDDSKPERRRAHGDCPWRAKIADFGLARPIEHAGTLTLDGALCGTPVYISPEQIRDPSVVDGRCDVYSLGVTLYESLTGEVPFRGTTPMVLQQAVNDEPRPPGRMAEGVPRDLETICLKAMAKETDRRYASPQVFADDLRRWLRGEPILARPSRPPELFVRWCRRNPRVAALSATASVLLVITAVASVSAAVLIARAQRRTVRALAVAKDQRALALDSLNDLISRVQNVLADRPGTLPLRQQILSHALQNLQRIARDADSDRIVDHDTIVANQRIGDVLWISGSNADARKHYQRSLELAESLLRTDPTSSTTKRDLAWAHDKLGVLDQHALRPGAALEHYRTVLELRDQVAKHQPKDLEVQRELVAAVKRLGDVSSIQGDHPQSRMYYERALKLARSLASVDPANLLIRRDLLNALRKVAWACLGTGDNATAERHLVDATTLVASLRKTDPRNLTWRQEEAWLYQDLGTLKYQLYEYDDAVKQLRVAVDAQTALVHADPDHAESQWNLAQAEKLLSYSYASQGRYLDAREHAQSAATTLVDLAEKNPSATKYWNDASMALSELASIEWRLGQFDDAGGHYEHAARLLGQLESRGELQSADMKSFKELMELMTAALPFRQRALESQEFVASQPRAIAPVLLCGRAYGLARAGRYDDVVSTAELAGDFIPTNRSIAAIYWFTIARSYALTIEGVRGKSQPSEADGELINRCMTGAKEAMEKCLALAPYFRNLIAHEPELRSVK
jgi:serine/threonine protein kinase